MNELTYETIVCEFLRRIPEARPSYEDLKEFHGDVEPDPHVVFGAFNGRLIQELEMYRDNELLRRFFTLAEEMASARLFMLPGVVKVTVCEKLGDDQQVLETARALMGPRTLLLSQEIERELGREL